MSVDRIYGVWLLSCRKLTPPTARTMPLAQAFGLPCNNGDGRLRPSFSANLRQSTAYSSFRCSLQNWSINPMTTPSASSFSSLDGGFGIGLGFGTFGGNGVADIGNDGTIPCRAFASLKLSLIERRMPGPNEML